MVTGSGENNNKTRKADEGFYTLKAYQRSHTEEMTSSMEDYLEMICRMEGQGITVRVGALARNLHVRPSSASKMLANLNRSGYIDFKKYGVVEVTEKGRREGAYLLKRHQILHEFFCALNGTENELDQVEKIEHFIHKRAVENLERITELLKKHL